MKQDLSMDESVYQMRGSNRHPLWPDIHQYLPKEIISTTLPSPATPPSPLTHYTILTKHSLIIPRILLCMEYHYAKTLCTCKAGEIVPCSLWFMSGFSSEGGACFVKLMIKLLAIANHLGVHFKAEQIIYIQTEIVFLEFHWALPASIIFS